MSFFEINTIASIYFCKRLNGNSPLQLPLAPTTAKGGPNHKVDQRRQSGQKVAGGEASSDTLCSDTPDSGRFFACGGLKTMFFM